MPSESFLFCSVLQHFVDAGGLESRKIMAVPSFLYATAAGIASHLAFFIRGEHHLRAPKLSRFYLVIAAFLLLIDSKVNNLGLNHAALSTISILGAYAIGLFASMITYRLFFHELRHFPGPFLAKVTKFWHTFHVLDAKQYLLLEKLHMQYGDFVRTGKPDCMKHDMGVLKVIAGPNEVTIFRPDALKPIHGYGSKCTKSAWYDNLKPYTAMNTTRIKSEHDRRRRVYDQGLSIKGSSLLLYTGSG